MAGFGIRPRPRHVVEDPGDLGCREVGGKRKTRHLGDAVADTVTGQRIQPRLRAGVLPHDGVENGLPGAAVPHDRGLALVRDPGRGDTGCLQVSLGEDARDHPLGVGPDLHGVVLDPAGARKYLLVLALSRCNYRSGTIEHDCPRRGGALVDG